MEDGLFEEEQDPPKIKRAVIAGASEALKYKASERKKTDDIILQEIADRIDEIIAGID